MTPRRPNGAVARTSRAVVISGAPSFFDPPEAAEGRQNGQTPPTSRDNHQDRMREKALSELEGFGFNRGAGQMILKALAQASTDYCVCCGYKRKGATGTGGDGTLDYLDGLEEVVRNRQRDGDAGDLEIRERHYIRVLRAFWLVTDGLTDEELTTATRIFHDSAKGARANLVAAGYVRASTRPKRYSANDRPMTVWELTPQGRSSLDILR
jgi:hypothetical protein